MKKRILSLLLAVMLCVSLLAVNVSAAAVYDYGVCGDNLTWTLKDGVLTISGEGTMTAWFSSTNAMWSVYKSEIHSVVIEEGVTDIADYAFYTCRNLTSVSIPESVVSIGNYAFAFCTALESLELPAGVSTILSYTFYYCTALNEVSFSEGLVEIGANAFACTALTEVTLPASVSIVKDQAFAQNSSLTAVTVLNDNTLFGVGVFNKTAAGIKLYANSGSSAEAYAKANNLGYGGIHSIHTFGDWTVTEDATCTEAGSRTRKCEGCDVTETEEIAALGHTAGAEADCENAQVCTVCDAVLADALGHTPGAEADCENAQVCTVCDAVLADALGHTPGAEADCENAQVCTVCDAVLADALGHTAGDEADCENAQVCTVCDAVLADALGHTPGAEADCENAQVCTVCDAVLTDALGHTPGAEADCENAQVCTVCDAVLADALGHTPGDPATCTENQTCTVCGEVLTEAGHTAGAPATCTEDQTCTVCGEVLVEATGHNPGEEATCTEDQICTVCEEVLAEAPGHVPGAEATCTHVQTCKNCDTVLASRIPHTPGAEATCTEDQTCTVCGEVLVEAYHIPGEAATCTSTQDCTRCGAVLAEKLDHTFPEANIQTDHPHHYVTECEVCHTIQYTPNAETYLHPGCADCYPYFTLYGAGMTLGNELALNFFIPKDAIYDDTYYAVLTRYYADGRDTVVLTVPYAEWADFGTLYYVTYPGIAAKEMTDTITVEIYNGDGFNVSELWTDSITGYLMRTLDNPTFNAEQKTWAVDAMNYGAAAQVYFGYNTENLANAALTDEQKALATQSIEISSSRIMTEKCFGSGLTLESNIILNVFFKDIENTEGMYATVFYTNHYGENIDITVYADSFINLGNIFGAENLYAVPVNTLVAADASQPVTVIMYNANNTVYGRCTDSVEGYCARMTTGDDLFTAVMKFTTSAYAMFH